MRNKIVLLLCVVFTQNVAAEGETTNGYFYEDPSMRIQLSPRTPDQMAAFYEARGFDKKAIKPIRDACFITVGVGNSSEKIIWLEPATWKIHVRNVPIIRYDQAFWKTKWDQLKVPDAQQSTFGWTLLPESRDLRPNEPVGGNITIPPIEEPFMLEAHFRLGENKDGEELVVTFNNVRCAKDLPPAQSSAVTTP